MIPRQSCLRRGVGKCTRKGQGSNLQARSEDEGWVAPSIWAPFPFDRLRAGFLNREKIDLGKD